MTVLYIRSSKGKEQLASIVRRIPHVLQGTAPDPHSLRTLFWGRIAHYLFTKVYEAYEVKSEGGTDELGNKWKPLSPYTIARRPLRRGDIGKYGLGGRGEKAYQRRVRGLLTPSQDRQWRAIFVSKLIKLSPVMGHSQARAEAAKIAWNILKARGAQTLVDTLGQRDVLIMRVTDTLYNSYRPGRLTGKNYIPVPNQVYDLQRSGLQIGSSVPYSQKAESLRPVWPRNMDRWVDEAIDAAAQALSLELARVLQ